MLQVQSPYQQFFEVDGTPLNSGKIYIGAAGSNPETTSTNVYWDSAGTIDAAQPLRTSGGYIVRNGTPAIVYISGEDYSITVRSVRDTIIYTNLNATAAGGIRTDLALSSGSSLVNFIEAGTGAVSVTVQTRLRYEIWSSDYAGTDTQKIQQAITYASSLGGGTVNIPAGTYSVTELTIPASVQVRGAGARATQLTYTGTGTCITLGAIGTLSYGTALSDLSIELTTNAGNAVLCIGTAGARVSNLYLQGYINAGRTNRGVTIDGGNVSSFFNTIEDVICNHMENSYVMTTSGSTGCTDTYFKNCTAFGDVASVGTASVGFTSYSGNGQGSVFTGGNLEACAKGIQMRTSTGGVTFVGTRFEGGSNTVDIQFDAFCNTSAFLGCKYIELAKVTDNSGTGYGGHSFLGCTDQNGQPLQTEISGNSKLESQIITDVPLLVKGYPTQTSALVEVRNGSNVLKCSIDGDGNILTVGNITGPGGSSPLIKTTNALSNGAAAAAGTLLNAPVAGNPTKWIAINDAGTTRYIPTWS